MTEYFAEGTVPTGYCDVHSFSNVCTYSGLNATEECPFKNASIVENIPARLQDNNLASAGNTTQETDPNAEANTQLCPHTAAFFALPNAQEVLQQQMLEMQLRSNPAAAAEAAEANPLPASDTD